MLLFLEANVGVQRSVTPLAVLIHASRPFLPFCSEIWPVSGCKTARFTAPNGCLHNMLYARRLQNTPQPVAAGAATQPPRHGGRSRPHGGATIQKSHVPLFTKPGHGMKIRDCDWRGDESEMLPAMVWPQSQPQALRLRHKPIKTDQKVMALPAPSCCGAKLMPSSEATVAAT